MKKLFFIALILISFSGIGQVYQYLPQYGYQMNRVQADSVLKIPSDTIRNKSGIARIGTTLYAGNGTYWTAVSGGGSSYWQSSTTNNIDNTNSGNVGIGNTNPQYKLDVTGTINSTGNISTSQTVSANGGLEVVESFVPKVTLKNQTSNGGYLSMRNNGNQQRIYISSYEDSYINQPLAVGNSSVDASAQLDITASSKGLLIPRLTTTQRNNILTPATGLLIWNTTDSTLNQYRGLSGWAAIGSTYSAGYGLSLATTTFSADTAIVSTKAWRQKGVDSVVGLLGSYLPLAGATYSTTSGDGLALTTSTLTTGNLMKLTNTSTVNNGAGLLSIVSSGANSTASKTTYGQQISVTNTGTTSTNVGLLVTTSGGTNNYAALFTGNVGIGVTTPINTLDVVRGTAGTMTKGTYETASFERNADMKFGIYTSSASSADGASLAFGQTNLKANSNTVYPGFEMQYSYSATPETNKMVWNYLGRNASGSVTNYGTEIIKLYASGLVAINYASSAGVTVESKLAVGANSAAASSIVDITSTTKGLLIPRMTTTQMNAISSPATGLQVYNTTTSSNNLYDGTGWKQNATLGYVDKSANYTILTTDEIINCTTAAITITLPTAVGASGKNYTIINSTSGDVTINTTSSQTIGNLNTATSLTLANDKSVILVSSNAAWKIKAIY